MTPAKLVSTSLVLSALFLSARGLPADEVDNAVRAAFEETPADQAALFQPSYVVFDHAFAITPAKTSQEGKHLSSVSGKLTRSKTGEPDDVIEYRIKRERGAVNEMTIRINGGAWHPLSEASLKVLGDYAKGVEPGDKLSEVNKALRDSLDGTWQRAAEYLIFQIAVPRC